MRSAACWVARACRRKRSGAASQTLAREEVERTHPVGDRLHRLRAEDLDRRHGGVHARTAVLRAVGQAQDRDQQRDIGLDRGDHVSGRDVLLGDDRQQTVA
jgi:hypothetical protein